MVQEIAVGQTSSPIDPSLSALRPKMAIVTDIGTDHVSMFGGLDGIAVEKGKLVASLPDDGIAFLDADDPRILAMGRRRSNGRRSRGDRDGLAALGRCGRHGVVAQAGRLGTPAFPL
jgi:UDP-N-acetylmuramyl pentapeptide synthase